MDNNPYQAKGNYDNAGKFEGEFERLPSVMATNKFARKNGDDVLAI